MVTIREIAEKVGVSSATVSRVLNFDVTLAITPEKRQAIIETAEALNYATPRARRRAREAALHRVALVHFLKPEHELIDPYYVALRLGIESRCQALKIETVKVYHTDSMPDSTLLQSADGVIAIGAFPPADIQWLERHNRNVVFADFLPPGEESDAVDSDLRAAARKLLSALREMGYSRIGFAGWREQNSGDPFSEIRCRAYIEWMRGQGLFTPELCLTGYSIDRNTEELGHQLGAQLMALPERPDVIVTGNDNIAVGIYRAMHELGFAIPEDVAVASFNDISVAQFLNPPLTTVRLPSEEIGKAAVDLLLERLSGREFPRHISIGNRIIWRRSTRVPGRTKRAG